MRFVRAVAGRVDRGQANFPLPRHRHVDARGVDARRLRAQIDRTVGDRAAHRPDQDRHQIEIDERSAVAIRRAHDQIARTRAVRFEGRFDTLANQTCRAEGKPVHYKFIRARTLIYAGVLVAVSLVMLVALMLRTTVELNVLRDRAPLFVTLSDGQIRNAYTIHVLNKTHAPRDFALSVSGLAGATLGVAGSEAAHAATVTLAAKPDSVATYRLFVTVPSGTVAARASSPVRFDLKPASGPGSARYDSVFLAPAN